MALWRDQARNDLLSFCQYTKPDYQAAWFHREVAKTLERVIAGELNRVVLSMPPQVGKSELCSVRMPCYAIGKNPKLKVATCGYSLDIALRHSRHSKHVLTSPEYRELFPDIKIGSGDGLARESAAAWSTPEGGGYKAVGIAGGLSGFEVDIGIIDDPLKDREEANSPSRRDKVIDWYKSVLCARQPEAIIIVMTRWHPEDLAGYVLENEKDEGWVEIRYPAINENGEALWEENPKRNLDAMKRMKAKLGTYEWSALFQQEPVLRSGNIFNTDDIWIHSDIRQFPDVQYSRAWDLASTAKQRGKNDPDYTVGLLAAVTYTPEGLPELWIKDGVHCQAEAPERDALILRTHEQDAASVRYYIEGFGGYKDTATHFKRKLSGKRTVTLTRPAGDKMVKAGPLEPIFEAGNVHIMKGAWNDEFLKQFQRFDGQDSYHDDYVDAAGIILHEHTKPRSRLVTLG